jgi:hypothetical protein
MTTVSSRSVRVTNIPPEVDETQFVEAANILSEQSISAGLFSSGSQCKSHVKQSTSFASQFESFVGTITLPSEKHKITALKSHDTEWTFDDKFNGITVLKCPKEPDVESVERK